jgi:amidase
MTRANPSQSAFVPHDLKAPLKGNVKGPLNGVTVAVKDMYDIAGERVSGGSPSWLAATSPATAHSAVVAKLLAAGATINHKTVCDEFFYSIVGANFHYGTPLNPNAPARIPGGSSSGSASACASGACDVAIGSDTGGSVRVPASLCGLYGIRSTRGRIDLRGAMAMAPSFDAVGWFARSAEKFALLGPILLDGWVHSVEAPRHLSLLTDMFSEADDTVAKACRAFLQRAAGHLPPSTEVILAGDRIDGWREALRLTQASEVWRSFGPFITQHKPHFGPGVAGRMETAASVSAADVTKSRPVLDEVTTRLEEATRDNTILALPTCPTVAPKLDASQEELERYRVRTMRLVCSSSISGLPQVTVPITTLDGAPVGLSFIGWRNGEEPLLALVQRLEAAGLVPRTMSTNNN